MKSYTRDFEIKDRLSQSTASKELIEKRRTVYDEYMAYRRKKEKELEVLKLQYAELRQGTCKSFIRFNLSNFYEPFLALILIN